MAHVPYRGEINHGVTYDPDSARAIEEAGQWEEGVTEYEDEKPAAPDPVPVRVVNQGSRELKRFSVALHNVTVNAVQIADRDESRTGIRIRNTGAITVHIGPTPNVGVFSGYPVAANSEITLVTTEPIWIVEPTNNATPPAVYVLQEFSEAVK